jgi:hypothetical protein
MLRGVGMIRATLAALALVIALQVGAHVARAEAIPACAEDVVIIGVGSFEDGRWSAYTCGPAADDLGAE